MTPTDPTAFTYADLQPGDPAPGFKQRTKSRDGGFAWDTLAGRYVVFCFYGSAGEPAGRAALEALLRNRAFFDDERASFFGVSVDPADESGARVQDSYPGIRFMWDFDASASRRCGAAALQPAADGQAAPYRRFWLVIDPSLHVLATFPFSAEDPNHQAVFDFLQKLPRPGDFAGFTVPAPVLILPNVFEPDLCRTLISLYDEQGGGESGVMRNGVGVMDGSFKRRKDATVTDERLIATVQERIRRRVIPEIGKLFFMRITRMERYIVGCYAAEDGGHFQPHRDNAQGITEHRRFAVSINLNGDFDGGEVSFPEYNLRGYKAPPGWAVVFPCAILHAVSKVTRGRRYAFLPFVYDESGAQIRAQRAREREAAAAATGTPAAEAAA